jgi:hypothetical protein
MHRLRLWAPILATLGLTLSGCSACRPPPLAAVPSPGSEASPAAYRCGGPGNPCQPPGQLCQLQGEGCTPPQRAQFCLTGTPRCAGVATAALIPVVRFF